MVSCTALGLFPLILDWSLLVVCFWKSFKTCCTRNMDEVTLQYIQLNPILKNRYVYNGVVSRNNIPIYLSANKHKLIWCLTVLHKIRIYIPIMAIALAKQEGDFLLRRSQFLFRCAHVNCVHAHFCTCSATGIGSASAKT